MKSRLGFLAVLLALGTANCADDGGADNTGGTGGVVSPRCGDGVVDAGETCDRGAENSDTAPGACRTDCTPARCGDGVVDGDEACDDGTENSDTEPGACRTDCRAARCGDGVVDDGETCDDGAENSDTAPGACRTDCRAARCGDGVIDTGEECDDGAENSDTEPGACRTDCLPARCGDGVVDEGEPCDDGAGNGNAPDACREGCVAPFCGDGIRDSSEGCDEGAENDDTRPGACRTDCRPADCGDGIADPGEECDDGAENSDTEPGACRTTCLAAHCGDGVLDAGETCDEGAENGNAPGACRATCIPAACGDGVTDPGEECDDGEGNGTDPGACRPGCIAPVCGDGIVDPNETCDDGEANDDEAVDACRTTCRAAGCGDGVLDTGEECDDGNLASGDDCSPTCTFAVDTWGWQKQGVVFDPPAWVTNAYGCLNCDGAPALVNVNGTLHLFFARLPEGTSSRKLYRSTSTDGENFSTPVAVEGLTGTSHLDPTVVHDGTTFHLWYLAASKINYATSTDGQTWTVVAENVVPKGAANEFDEATVRYPTVLPDPAGGWTLWYTGATRFSVFTIGRATSADGVTWTKTGQVLDRGAGTAFDNAAVAMPRVIPTGGGFLMWYGGYDLSRTTPGPYRIGAATSANGILWDKVGVSIPLSSTGTESQSVREPAVAQFGSGWVMIYAGLGDDGFYRLHRATSNHVLP
jgi:cysteine-rich repeat protein